MVSLANLLYDPAGERTLRPSHGHPLRLARRYGFLAKHADRGLLFWSDDAGICPLAGAIDLAAILLSGFRFRQLSRSTR
jgi:hypothetical protein